MTEVFRAELVKLVESLLVTFHHSFFCHIFERRKISLTYLQFSHLIHYFAFTSSDRNLPFLVRCDINQDDRIHLAYFLPSNFKIRIPLEKKTSTLQSNFPNFKSFLFFFQEIFKISVEKTFQRINIIWYIFYRKFATFTDFEKNLVFSKKNPLFSKKTSQFSYVFEKSYYFHRKFTIVWWWKMFKFRIVFRSFCAGNWQANIKKKKPHWFDYMIFRPYYEYGWKILT